MPESTEETIRRAFAASAEDYESVLHFVHPDFVMVTPIGLAAEPDTYSGPEGVRRWFESFFEVMDEVDVVPVEIEPTSRADTAAVEFDLVARGRASGIEMHQRAYALCRTTEGQLLSIEFFHSLDEAHAALR